MIIFALLALSSAYLEAYIACAFFTWTFFYMAFNEASR